MASIKIAKGGIIFVKRKSTTFLDNTKKWQSWHLGSPSPPQGTKPAARDAKGIRIKIVEKIIKGILFIGFN